MKSVSELVLMGLALALAACDTVATSDADARGADHPLACARCHTPEFVTTTHPPHASARPPTCAVCHAQTSWRFRLSHPTYELTGAHLRAAEDRSLAGTEQQVKCFWCHRGDPNADATYTAVKHECIACHAPDRDAAKPSHATFPLTCESCHTTEAWKPATKPAAAAPAKPSAEPAPTHAADAGAPPKPKPAPAPKPTPTATPHPTIPAPDVTSNASRHR